MTGSSPHFSDDYFRVYGRSPEADLPYQRCFRFLTNHALRYLYFMRKIQRNEDPLGFFRLVKRGMKNRFGLAVDSQSIGRGLYLGHPYNISVCSGAVIGENCNLNKGAAIEEQTVGKCSGAPVLGNRVWVGANAVISGNISIGDNVLIAPNAYVDKDVPSDSIVIGNPAVIHTGHPTAVEGYISNPV